MVVVGLGTHWLGMRVARAWLERAYLGMFAHLLEWRAEVFGWVAWLHTCSQDRGTCSGDEEASASVCVPARGIDTARIEMRSATAAAPLLVGALHMHLLAELRWPGAPRCIPVWFPIQSGRWQQGAALAVHLRRRAAQAAVQAGRLPLQTAGVRAATASSALHAALFGLPLRVLRSRFSAPICVRCNLLSAGPSAGAAAPAAGCDPFELKRGEVLGAAVAARCSCRSVTCHRWAGTGRLAVVRSAGALERVISDHKHVGTEKRVS